MCSKETHSRMFSSIAWGRVVDRSLNESIRNRGEKSWVQDNKTTSKFAFVEGLSQNV